MSAFVFRQKPVWRDMDALRHVNNAVYLTYLENAREAMWAEAGGRFDIFPFTLAHVDIDYRSAATWRDELLVKVRVSRIGNSSFELSYEIDAADGRRVADAKTVLVMMNADHSAPQKLSDDVRQKLSRWQ